MGGFDAGALLFKIQTVGAAIFKQDQSEASQALEKTGRSAKAAASDLDKSGESTDNVGKKARNAKGPLNEQADATKRVGDESRNAKPPQEEQAKVTEKQAAAAKQLSAGLLVAGVAVTALVGLSVAKYAEFDVAMSNVRAATMATAEEQRALADAALESGADTAYSASEAAGAQEELAKASLNVADIVGGSLNGALALAAAGQLAVARSAEIMATTLKVYRLPAEQAAHVSDLLAAAAGKAQGSVDDVALALDYAGIGLAQFNVPLEESVGALALFAANGILGEKAGTGLRGALASLTGPSAIGAKTMKEYGVEVFDAQGNFIGLAGVAGQLRTAFADLTEKERAAALNRIFGNESMNVANVLYKEGAEGVQEWTAAVDDSGYAAQQAAIKQDNLAGDVEKLGGAFDTAFIKTGSGANEVLRTMVQAATELVDIYGELPAPVQTTALVIGVATAAVLLFSGAAVGLRVKFIELKAQMDLANASFGRTAILGGAAGIALTGVIAIVALLAQRQAEARQRAESYADTLEDGNLKITKSTKELAVANLQAQQSFLFFERGSALDAAEKLGVALDTAAEAALGQADALKELSTIMKAADGDEAALQRVMDDTGLSRLDAINQIDLLVTGIRSQGDALNEARRLEEQKNKVTEDGTEVTKTAAQSYVEAADSVDDLQSELSDLIDTIMEANGANLDAREANRRLIESLADFDEALATNGATLDLNTEAGRENESNLDDIASAAIEAAKAITDSGGSYDDYRASLESSRQSLLDRINDLGITGEEAEALADKILRIPTESEWKMIAQTAEAADRISRIQSAIDQLRDKTVKINVTRPDGKPLSDAQIANQFGFGSANGNLIESYANGGVRENHVAQMARAGAYRVWAEPETGGESYVPHALSKRARSEQIMAETAAILGGVYIPSGAKQFASGAVATGAPSTGSLDGLRLTGTLDLGDGLMGFVDARINSYDRDRRDADRAGYRGGL